MIPELGHFSLILALGLSLSLAVLPAMGVWRGNAALMRSAGSMAVGLFVFMLLSFCCLAYAFFADDFSVSYVARNSNSALPIQFKLSAVWGAHEGSFLLWTLIMSFWTVSVALFSQSLPPDMKARVLSVMGCLTVGFILFMLFTSNPFDRNLPVFPHDGSDLNPLLQDFGLIVHPPMLYMGYVGFAVPFAFAIATLTTGRLDTAWARWSRPWTNVAWAFLTVGITLGSWWAYYELGWGGWWFWDAVENASFMPWLMGTALIHSLAATEKRGVFKGWTVLLAIATFSLSLLGAFLVRSGVLTSVHAFAVDPERGMFILIFLVLVIGSSLTLYAVKASGIKSDAGFSVTGRESMLLVNNLLLVVATAAVLLGTLYPLLYEVLTDGDKISVGPPYFNSVFVPIVSLLFLAMLVAPFSRWKKTDLNILLKPHWIAAVGALALVLLTTWFLQESFFLVAIGFEALGVWMLFLLLQNWWQKSSNKQNKFIGLFQQSASYLGMLLAHSGIVIALLGVVITVYYSEGRDVRMTPGETVSLRGYDFRFEKMSRVVGPNYVADRGHFVVLDGTKELLTLHPEKRHYKVAGSVMTEADLDPSIFRDLYVALGEPIGDDAWAVRIHVKPFVRWIWFGGLFIACGGFLTIFDKRYRRRIAAQASTFITDAATV